MSFVNNIFNGMARGFAFGMFGMNPFFSGCCCNYNPLYMMPNPFMTRGFFPLMPQITPPVFNIEFPTTYTNFEAVSNQFTFEQPKFDFSNMTSNNNIFGINNSNFGIGDTFTLSSSTNTSKTGNESDKASDVTKSSSTNKTSGKQSSTLSDSSGYLNTKDKYYTEMRDFIIKELEGGYSNIKGDHGKETYKGVTQGTYDQYRDQWGKSKQNIKKITDEEVNKIYYSIYKDAGVDKITNPRLALYVFAQAVNSGPSVAKELLEKSGGDIDKYEQLQRARYNRLANGKDQGQFRKGWQNRVTRTKDFAMNKLPDNINVSVA